MALILPTAGPYICGYAPKTGTQLFSATPGPVAAFANVGLCRRGWDLMWEVREYRTDDTTSWGRSLIELIYLGADWSMRATALEYFAPGIPGALSLGFGAGGFPEIAWPWGSQGTTVGARFGASLQNVGQRASNSASGILTLLSVAGTTASASPAVFTASQAVSGSGGFGFNSQLRESNLHMRLIPYSTALPNVITTIAQNLSTDVPGSNTIIVTSMAGAANSGVGIYTRLSDGTVWNFSYTSTEPNQTAFVTLSVDPSVLEGMIPISAGDPVSLPSSGVTTQWFTTS